MSARLVDLAFARRLELVSGVSSRECAAASEEIAGGIAAFAGVDSPVTQAFGCGLDGAVEEAEFDRLEDFFFSRGAAVTLELSPFIDQTLVALLQKRPYRLEEFSNVLVRDILPGEVFAQPASPVTVRAAESGEAQLFIKVVTDGFAEQVQLAPSLEGLLEGFFHRARGQCFFGLVDGEIAGAGGVAKHDNLAELYGASTLPKFRNRGVQTALIRERLAWGAQRGCDIATTTTGPGTSSQRNFERAGFQTVYSRTKLVRKKETS